MADLMADLSMPGLEFIWPSLLWLLVIVPIAVAVYQFVRRHERTSITNIVAGALVTIGLVSIVLAVARPKIQVNLPSRADQLMVVLDISGSMSATDVEPDRFEAAKQTLRTLIAKQPQSTRLGLVTTAASATLIQPPTTERDAITEALNTVTLQTGSALGSGVLIGLSELLPGAGIDVQSLMNDAMQQNDMDSQPSWQPDPNVVRPVGSNRSAAMVLISDGESNMGPDVLEMAALASQFGVRIHTIGIGTSEGAVVKAEGVSQRVRLESSTLSEIANATLGTYYEGASEQDLIDIFSAIDASISFDRRQTIEVSSWLLLVGMLLVLMGMALKFVRQGRVL